MKAKLQYIDDHGNQKVQAAFLSGGDLAAWLSQLQPWGIPLDQLECYLVPRSLESRIPAGLLVIFPKNNSIAPQDLLQPCYLLGDRLVLPLEASLFPAVDSAQFSGSLGYERLFFHPTIGLVGFEATDRIQWESLIALPSEHARDWGLGHPGLAPSPPLQNASVPPATLAAMAGDIGSKSLHQIPGGDQDGESEGAFGRFRSGLFKGAYQMTKGLMDQFPEGDGDGGAGYHALAKFANWLGKRTEGLQDKRQDAIDRLLDLLHQDLDNALKYAIPLDNPFAARGLGEAGSDLGARDTRFDASKFGGTTASGTWSVDTARYQSLRERYLRAANDAVAAGDFGKAAYIYAHLLHDFQAAANVLEQGKMYREAALVYKDHLKNPAAAAACLEKGGLYMEAIDLYLELKQWEKAGDLYRILAKEAKALEQYERCVDAALAQSDYLTAAKFQRDKMYRLDRALVTWLLGWHDQKQSEACLRCYLTAVNVPSVNMAHQIQMLYSGHTSVDQRDVFLAVLAEYQPLLQQDMARAVSREIAYTYLSAQVQAGQTEFLRLLKQFVTQDRLIASDIGRFTSAYVHRPKPQAVKLRLNPNIRWYACKQVGNCYVALGSEGRHLWLARWDLKDHVEYYHWAEETPEGEEMLLLTSEKDPASIFLLSPAGTPLSPKTLPKNAQFDRLIQVGASPNLPKTLALIGGCFKSDGNLLLLCQGSQITLTLQTYSLSGQLLETRDCINVSGEFLGLEGRFVGEVLAINGGCIAYFDELMLHILYDGTATVLPLESESHGMAVDLCTEPPLLVFESENGCHLIPATQDSFSNSSSVRLSKSPGAYLFCFLPRQLLTVVWEDKVAVFSTAQDATVLIGEVALEEKVIGIVQGDGKQQVCLIAANGMIVRYEIRLKEDGMGPEAFLPLFSSGDQSTKSLLLRDLPLSNVT